MNIKFFGKSAVTVLIAAILGASLCILMLLGAAFAWRPQIERFLQAQTLTLVIPEVQRRLEYRDLGAAKAEEYINQALRPSELAKSYRADGPYYGYAKTRYYRTGGRVLVDEEGFPKIKYGNEYYYNPVTLAQQALAEYSREGGPTPMFLRVVDKLLTFQDERGAFLYPFKFRKYAHGEDYEPGWISGMAQGQALSVLARAWHLTKDERYLLAGKAALDFMQVTRGHGGPLTTLAELNSPALSNHLFVMEYPATPAVYTLNGFMFVIQGVYDWSVLADPESGGEAKNLFDKFLETLVILLPYYDLGTFSSYDLSYITLPILPDGLRRKPHIHAAYHAVHIEQLWALYFLTKRPVLKETADRWERYVTR
ncbi:D-glucuronyl C5-epimerase family protein [Aquamicrobium lusatiense]|uniref:D-glucuronyl C5-epimerase family protein n=1 Tax=Aquamicrobium lusatiense TaxID=89772 RepID=UPI002458E205|nr:D-glucuronyl C5-epimerase family protein [Aquamicrobium lusatiense]MDH4992791.1 D-glucuronyl C5-epimerase family protein [Aquamicrobium lusatiense]